MSKTHDYGAEMAELLKLTRRLYAEVLKLWLGRLEGDMPTNLDCELGRCAANHMNKAIEIAELNAFHPRELLLMMQEVINFGQDLADLQAGYQTVPTTQEEHAERAERIDAQMAAAKEGLDLPALPTGRMD